MTYAFLSTIIRIRSSSVRKSAHPPTGVDNFQRLMFSLAPSRFRCLYYVHTMNFRVITIDQLTVPCEFGDTRTWEITLMMIIYIYHDIQWSLYQCLQPERHRNGSALTVLRFCLYTSQVTPVKNFDVHIRSWTAIMWVHAKKVHESFWRQQKLGFSWRGPSIFHFTSKVWSCQLWLWWR